MTDSSQNDSLARTIGSTLWKGYDDLISTMSGTKKKQNKLPPQQIPLSLSKWEDALAEKKKKTDVDY